MLDSDEQRKKKISDHDNQMSFLPVSNLQERFIGIPTLSDREFEIMQMTLSGVEIEQIAMKIFMTEHCVKWRLSHIYWKFNSKNRLQLINKAVKTGLHFNSESGIAHSFSIAIDMQGHLKKDESNDKKKLTIGSPFGPKLCLKDLSRFQAGQTIIATKKE